MLWKRRGKAKQWNEFFETKKNVNGMRANKRWKTMNNRSAGKVFRRYSFFFYIFSFFKRNKKKNKVWNTRSHFIAFLYEKKKQSGGGWEWNFCSCWCCCVDVRILTHHGRTHCFNIFMSTACAHISSSSHNDNKTFLQPLT